MTSPNITIVTDANFVEEVLKSDKLVLIDFHATWCGPCKSMAPALDQYADENKATVKVVKVDVDQNPRLVQAFGIRSMPTLVTMKNGKGLIGSAGAIPKSGIERLVAESIKLAASANEPPAPKGPTI